MQTMGIENGAASERPQVLAEATRTVSEHVTGLAHLLRTITERGGRLLGAHCLVGLVSDDRTRWQFVAEYSSEPASIRELRRANDTADEGPHGSPAIASDGHAGVGRDGRSLVEWWSKLEPSEWAVVEKYARRKAICVPMRWKGDLIGTLAAVRVADDAAPFAASDVDLLQLLADHAAQTILHARSLEAMQRELADHRRTRESLGRIEEKLHQTAKMEAIGRLAGGVAHDFNNILSIILGFSQSVLEALPDDSALRGDMEEISRAGERAAALTRQLLAFTRNEVVVATAVDLNRVIAGMEPMLRRLLGEDVDLHLGLKTHLERCQVDPRQMEQILMNLAVNARDAMPTGGQLTIETGHVLLDEEYVRSHPDAKLGLHVILSVTDTGVGMDRATLARIFEPFFTTKPRGVGTGLGLATVYGIVHQSGGNIWVYSEPGKGTTFKVQLPVTAELPPEQQKTEECSAPAERGSETILVVEDDGQVRSFIRTILTRAGYRVLEASNGQQAELIMAGEPQRPELLLTDVVMPKLSGRQVAERMTERYPKLRVLYMSGYAENAIVSHGVLSPGIQFIAKPITSKGLLRRVREVLAVPAPRLA